MHDIRVYMDLYKVHGVYGPEDLPSNTRQQTFF